MLKCQFISRFIFMSLMMVVLLAANTACATDVGVPPKTAAIIFLGQNGKVLDIKDADGKRPVNWCVLPGVEYRDKLSELYKIPYCKAKTTVTADRGDPINVFFNKQNPCYITIYIDGMQVEIPVPDAYCQ